MVNVDFKEIASRYEKELRENCLPFWLEHSQDKEYGGYFSCLNRDGSVYDTDKFIWLQGREVWLFAMLYNNVEKNQQWLDCAVQGAEFLKTYGHDENWDFYFSLDRKGNPLFSLTISFQIHSPVWHLRNLQKLPAMMSMRRLPAVSSDGFSKGVQILKANGARRIRVLVR